MMKICKECNVLKNEDEFPKHRFGLSSTCKPCTELIRNKKAATTMKGILVSGAAKKPTPPARPEGAIHKRCPNCRAHVYVVQTDKRMACWKCGKDLKIVIALRDSTLHRGGVILRVVD